MVEIQQFVENVINSMNMRDNKGKFVKGNSGFWLGKKRPNLKNTNAVNTMFSKGFKPWNEGKANMLICLNCKNEFKSPPSEAKRRKYCSNECKSFASPFSRVKIPCPECKEHMIQKRSKLCRSCNNKGSRGPGYRNGKPFCPNCKKQKNIYSPGLCRECFRGKNHFAFKDASTENQKIRASLAYKRWRTAVFERDNYTCQMCGARGIRLNADHIKPFSLFPDLRLDINNGRTLCVECHKGTPTYLRNYKHIYAE